MKIATFQEYETTVAFSHISLFSRRLDRVLLLIRCIYVFYTNKYCSYIQQRCHRVPWIARVNLDCSSNAKHLLRQFHWRLLKLNNGCVIMLFIESVKLYCAWDVNQVQMSVARRGRRRSTSARRGRHAARPAHAHGDGRENTLMSTRRGILISAHSCTQMTRPSPKRRRLRASVDIR